MHVRKQTELTPCKEGPTSVALGLFDGVHLGHQQVLQCVLAGRTHGLAPAVFTFEQADGLVDTKEGGLIYSEEYKQYILEKMGFALLLAVPFETVRGMSPSEFVDTVLQGTLHAGQVVCGYDFRFGRDAGGDAALLRQLCEKRAIGVQVVPALSVEGAPVSSTRIRSLLRQGKIEQANTLCGRPYGIYSTVLSGNRLGRVIGFPTINQRLQVGRTLPRFGVYASETTVDGAAYRSITNIGVKPTVGSDTPLAETHILHFQGELYGRRILVRLLRFLRPEQKFRDVEQLRLQMQKDVSSVEED